MREHFDSPEAPKSLVILHADDNPDDRFFMERSFKRGFSSGHPDGHRLISVDGGAHKTIHTLADYILARNPHLVIADGDMGPEVTGPLLAEALLSKNELGVVPSSGNVHRRMLFVLLSGGGRGVPSEEVLKLMKEGGIHVLIHKDKFFSDGLGILSHLARLCRFMNNIESEPPHDSIEAARQMTSDAAKALWHIHYLSPMHSSPHTFQRLTSEQERSWLAPDGHLDDSEK